MAINDPTDITGLRFWGDADHVVESPSGFVERMTDRSGNAHHISNTDDTEKPALVVDGGVSGLQFDGVDDELSTQGTGGSDPMNTIVMIVKLPATPLPAGTLRVWSGQNDTGDTFAPMLVIPNAVETLRLGTSVGGISISPDTDWKFGDVVLVTILMNTPIPDDHILRINGIEKGTGSVTVDAVSGQTIGARLGGLGAIAETVYGLVGYSGVLSGSDLTDIEDWMMGEYVPLTANAGVDFGVDADETLLATLTLDGSASLGSIATYQWLEGGVPFTDPSIDPFLSLEEVTVGVHTYTLSIVGTDLSVETDTIDVTVSAFTPPTPPTIRTFKTITTSTATVHDFSSVFPLTDPLVAPLFTEHHNQLRVFIKDTLGVVTELFPVGRPDDGNTDFTINAAGTGIVLDTALVTTDTLLMMRDTQMNRAFVTLTNVARFRGRDRNVRGDQILFIAQELREIRLIADVLGSDSGELFEFDPTPIDRSKYNRLFTGDGVETDFSYSDIEMLPLEAVRHLPQLEVFIDDVLQSSGFTVTESTLLVAFSSAPADGELVEVRRATRIDQRWVQFSDGTTFSSLQDEWDFLNIKFLVQETQDFPTWLLPNALQNRIFARPLNALQYSGPGIKFYFGNLAWFGDGVVFIFRNDLLLVEGIDYTIDWNFFWINLTSDLGTGLLDIITTTPNHAFGGLGYSVPNGIEGSDTQSSDPTDAEVILLSIPASADAYMDIVYPTTNTSAFRRVHATASSVDTSRIPVMEFDVSSVDLSLYTEAKIQLFNYSSNVNYNDRLFQIRRCLHIWSVPVLTATIASALVSWGSLGGQTNGVDFDAASTVTWQPTILSFGTVFTSDMLSLIIEAQAQDGILRIILFPVFSTALTNVTFGTVQDERPPVLTLS